jgi:hypothetical protein
LLSTSPVGTKPSRWLTDWSPDQIVYVDAKMSGATAPTPAGRPTAAGDSENALQGRRERAHRSSAVVAALLLTLVGATSARYHLGGGQMWMVTAPVLLLRHLHDEKRPISPRGPTGR